MYRVKKFTRSGETHSFLMQNENGPCPLLAVANVLLLQRKIRIHPDYAYYEHTELVKDLTECLFSLKPPSDNRQNWEQSITDVVDILPSLQYGLDVNVRFDSEIGFEFTRQLSIFDIFDVRLLHGWIYDSSNQDYRKTIGSSSYNQLMESLVEFQQISSRLEDGLSGEDDPRVVQSVHKGIIVQDFLQETASQLTSFGIQSIQRRLMNDELAVFFRNNHFSTIYKYMGQVFILTTDQGFQDEENIIWERLDNVTGDNPYFDGQFEPYDPSKPKATQPEQTPQVDPWVAIGEEVTPELLEQQRKILADLQKQGSSS